MFNNLKSRRKIYLFILFVLIFAFIINYIKNIYIENKIENILKDKFRLISVDNIDCNGLLYLECIGESLNFSKSLLEVEYNLSIKEVKILTWNILNGEDFFNNDFGIYP